jgi:hypothetical protein
VFDSSLSFAQLLHNLGICQHLSSFRNSKVSTVFILSQEAISFRCVVVVAVIIGEKKGDVLVFLRFSNHRHRAQGVRRRAISQAVETVEVVEAVETVEVVEVIETVEIVEVVNSAHSQVVD